MENRKDSGVGSDSKRMSNKRKAEVLDDHDAKLNSLRRTCGKFTYKHMLLNDRLEFVEAYVQQLNKDVRELLQQKKLGEIAKAVKQKIILNVGGQTFTTTRENLMSIPDSFFHRMLSSGEWQPDEEGHYFVDRNPKYFDKILDYMRTGKFDADELTLSERKTIQNELDYYQLKLVVYIEWDSNCRSLSVHLSNRNQKAAMEFEGGWQSVFATQPAWKYKLKVGSGNIRMGFARRATEPVAWLLDVYKGKLMKSKNFDEFTEIKSCETVVPGAIVEARHIRSTGIINFSYWVCGDQEFSSIENVGSEELYPVAYMFDESQVLLQQWVA